MSSWHFKSRIPLVIAALAVLAIVAHLILRTDWPLMMALGIGGAPLIWGLLRKMLQREFGADLLAGISIVTSVLLGEYLAGVLVVLMLSGGEALESLAVARASSVLNALAKRVPAVAHCKKNGVMCDIHIDQVEIDDQIVILPHEICPVDGVVIEGHGAMDESYLTGEPYVVSKTPGSTVISGAVNGEYALTIAATAKAVNSRYAKIMQVMRQAETDRPRMRRIGDQIGAIYTPIAIVVAVAAWWWSGNPVRFLAVLVVATPCPLLIAIPVAIIGAISLAARRGIIIRRPPILERIDQCRTIIFDKTGTLTYGRPVLTHMSVAPQWDKQTLLLSVASLEQYSKHPLASAMVRAAKQAGLTLLTAENISEKPGKGVSGVVAGKKLQLTSRKSLLQRMPHLMSVLPPQAQGMEAVLLEDDVYAATLHFRDEARSEGKPFVSHLDHHHQINRVLLVSGDRQSEVDYLASLVGISQVYAEQSPQQKLEIVRQETAKAPTIFVGDGINDAPALMAASVGIAFGQHSDVTSEAGGAVVMDSSLQKVDELLHIGRRLRRVALQSAVGGMLLSVVGMAVAAAGYLPPTTGAIAQEAIDLLAIVNALRAAVPPSKLHDL